MSAILESFLNTAWQAAVIALVVWAGLRWMPRVNAATRGAIWCSVLAFILLLPAIRGLGERPRSMAPAVIVPARVMPDEVIQSRVQGTVARDETPVVEPVVVPVVDELPRRAESRPVSGSPAPPIRVPAGRWPTFFLTLWTAICIAQLTRLAVSYRHLRRLKRDARPAAPLQRANLDAWLPACCVRRPVRLLVSDNIAVPVAVGFLRPAVVLPDVLLAALTPVELDHVLLHELAHLARRDDWTNLLTRIAWAIFALHPVAAFVLRQIDRERELACDDWVVSTTGAARPYAASLARLFELCTTRRRTLLASGIADGGSQLGNRIALLLGRGREFTPQASSLRVALCTAALLILVIAGSRAPAWMAFAQTPVTAPEAPAPASARQASPAPALAAGPRSRARRTPAPASAADVAPQAAATPAPPAPASASAPTLAPAGPPAPAGNSLLAALVANGYGDLSVDEIIDLKNQGVSPDFIAGMSRSGIGNLRPRLLIELKQQGVRPDYVHDILALGFGPYAVNQFIEFKNQGVPIELFRALKDYGLLHAEPNEIREAKMHGVGSANLREAQKYSSKLTLKQIIRLKQAGVI